MQPVSSNSMQKVSESDLKVATQFYPLVLKRKKNFPLVPRKVL